jgi:hypothetical protein
MDTTNIQNAKVQNTNVETLYTCLSLRVLHFSNNEFIIAVRSSKHLYTPLISVKNHESVIKILVFFLSFLTERRGIQLKKSTEEYFTGIN